MKKKSHFVSWFSQLHPIFNHRNQCHDFSRWILKGALKIYNRKFQCNIKTSLLLLFAMSKDYTVRFASNDTRWCLHLEKYPRHKACQPAPFFSRTETLFNLPRSVLFHLSCSAHEDVSAGQFQVVRWAPEWDEPAVAVTYCCPWHGIGLSGNLRDNGRSASLPDCWVI